MVKTRILVQSPFGPVSARTYQIINKHCTNNYPTDSWKITTTRNHDNTLFMVTTPEQLPETLYNKLPKCANVNERLELCSLT